MRRLLFKCSICFKKFILCLDIWCFSLGVPILAQLYHMLQHVPYTLWTEEKTSRAIIEVEPYNTILFQFKRKMCSKIIRKVVVLALYGTYFSTHNVIMQAPKTKKFLQMRLYHIILHHTIHGWTTQDSIAGHPLWIKGGLLNCLMIKCRTRMF